MVTRRALVELIPPPRFGSGSRLWYSLKSNQFILVHQVLSESIQKFLRCPEHKQTKKQTGVKTSTSFTFGGRGNKWWHYLISHVHSDSQICSYTWHVWKIGVNTFSATTGWIMPKTSKNMLQECSTSMTQIQSPGTDYWQVILFWWIMTSHSQTLGLIKDKSFWT